jgi:hypothetical protein
VNKNLCRIACDDTAKFEKFLVRVNYLPESCVVLIQKFVATWKINLCPSRHRDVNIFTPQNATSTQRDHDGRCPPPDRLDFNTTACTGARYRCRRRPTVHRYGDNDIVKCLRVTNRKLTAVRHRIAVRCVAVQCGTVPRNVLYVFPSVYRSTACVNCQANSIRTDGIRFHPIAAFARSENLMHEKRTEKQSGTIAAYKQRGASAQRYGTPRFHYSAIVCRVCSSSSSNRRPMTHERLLCGCHSCRFSA